MAYKVYYFASRGRAEQIRLLLNVLEVPYEDVHLNREAFMALKEQGPKMLAFGAVPMLEDGDFRLAQAPVILSYLARKHGLAPADLQEAARLDAIALAAEDLRLHYFKCFGGGDDKEARQKEYLANPWKSRWLPIFESLLAFNGDTGYFVGSSITHADIAVWDILDATLSYVPGSSLEGFPKLQAFYSAIRERPAIAAYLASSRRVP